MLWPLTSTSPSNVDGSAGAGLSDVGLSAVVQDVGSALASPGWVDVQPPSAAVTMARAAVRAVRGAGRVGLDMGTSVVPPDAKRARAPAHPAQHEPMMWITLPEEGHDE